MRQRVEQIKGILLTVLVGLSIFLSGGLWNSSPVFEQVDQGGYTVNPAFGPGKSVEQVLLPTQIQAHFADNKFVVLGPLTAPYSRAWEEFRKLAIHDISKVDHPEAITQEMQTDANVRFQFGVTLSEEQVLQMIRTVEPFQFHVQASSIFVYRDKAGTGWAVFLHDDKPVYRGRVDGQSGLFEQMAQWVTLPKYAQRYSAAGSFLLPLEKMTVLTTTYERMAIPSETLARSFFVDPTLMRKIMEHDGSLILSDGNRTVQIASQVKTLHYTSPIPLDRKKASELRDNSFLRSVTFINEHGGMQGSYIGALEKQWGEDSKEYVFTEYRNGIPVITPLTGIHVSLTGNEVVELSRNVLYLGGEVREENVEINPPTANMLNRAVDAYLAYAPRAADGNRIQLVPVWVIRDTRDQVVMYDARTAEIWQDAGGWSNGLE